MNLCDGRGGERLVIQMGKYLIDGPPQPTLDFLDCFLDREGGNVFLERLERNDVVVGERVPSNAQRLAELDEGGAQSR